MDALLCLLRLIFKRIKNVLEIRVQKIENTLNEIVRRNLAPREFGVFPSILNKENVLIISPTRQPENSDFQLRQQWLLMTITAADSRLYGIPIPLLSKIGSKIVEEALKEAWKARQPHSLLQQGVISFCIFSLNDYRKLAFISFTKILSTSSKSEKIHVLEPPTITSRTRYYLVSWHGFYS